MGKRIPLALPFLPFSLCADAAQLTKHVRHLLFTAICLLAISFSAQARDFEYTYEGQTLIYTVIDEKAKTCMTKEGHFFTAGNAVSGYLIIPSVASDGSNEYSVTTIGDKSFIRCDGLTSVIIPNSVTSIGEGAFAQSDGLTSVTIPDSVISIGTIAFSGCGGLTSVTIPNSVTSIGEDAFAGCSGLSSVTISNSVTSIGERVFTGCSGLTSVTIPNSVTSIGEDAFAGCSGLSSVTISNSVTSIGERVFTGCSGLTSMTIPNSVTSIGEEAFSGCSGLTSVTIPNSVTSIGKDAFYWCSGLTSVNLPASVSSIGGTIFGLCTGLKEITVDSENKEYASIEGVLYNKDESKLIEYPGGRVGLYAIPNTVTSIGDGAFAYCFDLTSVTIPNSVTSIGDGAFAYCSGMSSVTIPESVISIGQRAFSLCDSLTEINYAADVPIEGTSDIFSANTYLKATLYVKEGALERAKEIDPWKNFSNIQTKEFGGVDCVVAGFDASLPVSVFGLNGVYVGNDVDNLAPGIYIVRQGSSVRKITVK